MELVTLRTYFDKFEANAHLVLLEHNGIEAIIENEDETSLTQTHVRLRVIQEDLEKAREILGIEEETV